MVHRKVHWQNPKLKSLNSMPVDHLCSLYFISCNIVSAYTACRCGGAACFHEALQQRHLLEWVETKLSLLETFNKVIIGSATFV